RRIPGPAAALPGPRRPAAGRRQLAPPRADLPAGRRRPLPPAGRLSPRALRAPGARGVADSGGRPRRALQTALALDPGPTRRPAAAAGRLPGQRLPGGRNRPALGGRPGVPDALAGTRTGARRGIDLPPRAPRPDAARPRRRAGRRPGAAARV